MNTMNRALLIHNSKCLKCDTIEKEMVKIGVMVFCNDCFRTEFVDSGDCNEDNNFDYDPKSETYQAWFDFLRKMY